MAINRHLGKGLDADAITRLMALGSQHFEPEMRSVARLLSPQLRAHLRARSERALILGVITVIGIAVHLPVELNDGLGGKFG